MTSARTDRGFTLFEVILVVLVVGVLATVAIRSGGEIHESARTEQTMEKMDAIAHAITGNPDLNNNGIRSDYGYVGDVGALPPDLDALYSNPGGYTTWNGPYIGNRFTALASDYKTDAWGTTFTYSGGATITSSGSGSNIVRRVADAEDDLLYNQVVGLILDSDGTPPGPDYVDSVTIRLTIPNGAGGTTTRGVTMDAGGYFEFDSIPIGNHDLLLVYEPDNDTLERWASVSPRSKLYSQYRLNDNVWYGIEDIPGLIGHYTLDEGAGQTASGGVGLAPPTDLQNDAGGLGWSIGKISGGFDFDGTDDYFETDSSSTDLQLADDYSLSAWIYADPSQVQWAGILTRCTPTGSDNHWSLQLDNGSGTAKALILYHPSGNRWTTTYTLADAMSAWHHLVITYRLSPTRTQLYVDGVLHSEATSLSAAPGSGNGRLRIGCDRSSNVWHGKTDDVRIYDRALSDSDIQYLYSLGS